MNESVLREGRAWGWIAPEMMDLQAQSECDLEDCLSREEVSDCYKRWCGVVRQKFRDMKDMEPEEKKVYGIMLNTFLTHLEIYRDLLQDEMNCIGQGEGNEAISKPGDA